MEDWMFSSRWPHASHAGLHMTPSSFYAQIMHAAVHRMLPGGSPALQSCALKTTNREKSAMRFTLALWLPREKILQCFRAHA
jgi:hypothetical protein